MMLSWLMHELTAGLVGGIRPGIVQKTNLRELLFVLLRNLAQRLEQRVLRPLDRPILLREGDLTGLQRRRDPGEHLIGRGRNQHRLTTDTVKWLEAAFGFKSPADVLCHDAQRKAKKG